MALCYFRLSAARIRENSQMLKVITYSAFLMAVRCAWSGVTGRVQGWLKVGREGNPKIRTLFFVRPRSPIGNSSPVLGCYESKNLLPFKWKKPRLVVNNDGDVGEFGVGQRLNRADSQSLVCFHPFYALRNGPGESGSAG